MSNQVLAILIIAFGSIILLLTAFAPKYLHYLPGNRWFWPAGPRASRFGSAVGGSACVIIGLAVLGGIPDHALGPVLLVLGVLVIAAAMYDFSRPAKLENPSRPIAYAKANRSQKRRKRKGRR